MNNSPLEKESQSQEQQRAEQFFLQGKWEEAAEAYGSLLETLTTTKGEESPLSIELAPFYYRYGRSLYHVGQAEIFSKATAEASHQIALAEAKGKFIEVAREGEEDESGDESEEVEGECVDQIAEQSVEQCAEQNAEQSVDQSNSHFISQSIPDSSAQSEPLDDLSLAWEALDTARIIWQGPNGSTSSRYRKELIQVFQALGDVAMENEAFSQAIMDYGEALRLLKEQSNEKSVVGQNEENKIHSQESTGENKIHSQESSLAENKIHSQESSSSAQCNDLRIIAEAHYKVALAHEYANQNEQALDNLKQAVSLLKEHKSSLSSPSSDDDALELQEVIQELEAKIGDFLMVPSTAPQEEPSKNSASNFGEKSEQVSQINDLTALNHQKQEMPANVKNWNLKMIHSSLPMMSNNSSNKNENNKQNGFHKKPYSSLNYSASKHYLHDPKCTLKILKAEGCEGRLVLGANSQGQIIAFDRSKEDCKSVLLPPVARSECSGQRKIGDLSWFPEDQGLFAVLQEGGEANGICSLWDTQAFVEVSNVNLRLSVGCLAFAPVAKQIGVGCLNSIRFLDLRSQLAVSCFVCSQEGLVQCLEWSKNKPFEAFYATNAGFLGKIDLRYLGQPADKFELQKLFRPPVRIFTMNRELISVDAAGSVNLWDFATGEHLEELKLPLEERKDFGWKSVGLFSEKGLLVYADGKKFGIWNAYAGGGDGESLMERLHPAHQCSFPFVEYNRLYDEVYLYNRGRIACILQPFREEN